MESKRSCRTTFLLKGAAVFLCSVQLSYAGDVSVNVHLGVPAPVVVAPPQPVYVPAPEPVYVAPPPPVYEPVEVIEIEDDFDFVYPSALGFYVAVGVPYDLFYLNNRYFLYRDGRWLCATSSRGPWVVQRYRELPQVLRRHRVERIREYRNREYAIYRRDRDHYRGRHFRAEKEHWKEQRKEERRYAKEQRKDERRWEKEQRKEERRWDKEQRKDERRHEREERRDHREGRDR